MPYWVWVRIEPRSSHTEGVCATNALLHIHLLVTNKTLKYKFKAIKMIDIKLERKKIVLSLNYGLMTVCEGLPRPADSKNVLMWPGNNLKFETPALDNE